MGTGGQSVLVIFLDWFYYIKLNPSLFFLQTERRRCHLSPLGRSGKERENAEDIDQHTRCTRKCNLRCGRDDNCYWDCMEFCTLDNVVYVAAVRSYS